MLDHAIVNGLVVTADGQSRLDVGIAAGKIALLAAPGSLPEAAQTIDASGLYVLPGIIDSHYHCRAPANPEREDFASGTRAAAAGGVTTVLEMPISKPPTRDGATLAARRTHAERDAYVDVGFYTSSATLDPANIQSALDEGALAFKAFLQEVPPGREEEFDGLCIRHHDEILRALELALPSGLPSVFHAEDYATYTYLEEKLRAAGRKDVAAHWEWRPDYVEAISISTLMLLAEATGAHVHLPHISSALSVSLIRDAKRRGAPITAETCPQYLVLSRATLEEHGPFAKCNPPLKTEADNMALWEGLRDGTIDTVATDHSPFTVAEKEAAWDDIWLAPPGFPGVEILTTFMLTAAADGKLPLERAIELVTKAPAAIFGISPRKGTLTPGADADLTLYNPTGHSHTDTTTWHTRSAACARVWHNYPITGHVTTTILRGKVIFHNGEILGQPGYGAILRPAPAPSSSPIPAMTS